MKIYRNIAILAATLAGLLSCQPKEAVDFSLDTDLIEMPEAGGTVSVSVSASGTWVALANRPWLTVSPANGSGSTSCQIIVDSAITLNTDEAIRTGVVTIQTDDNQSRSINIQQKNYGYTISASKTEIEVPDYEDLEDRHFDVTISSNTAFRISYLDAQGAELPADDSWIAEDEENPSLNLNKGARPRNVVLRFNWKINQYPSDRVSSIVFTPVDASGQDITMTAEQVSRMDKIQVTQTSAASKPTDPRAADSTALVAISRALNLWSGGWDTSVQMERWDDVVLWEDGDEGCPENGAGRVRYARFFMFNTADGIPYQVSWLDAAEELIFYSNENSNFREDIELGNYISQLHQLKRLTIAAYGLEDDSMPESFFTQEDGSPAFPKLEYLNLSSNNFSRIDPRFNSTNFPSLRAFMMRSNQKRTVYDLSTSTTSSPEQFADTYGGLYRENLNQENQDYGGGGFPIRFILWEKLDTLELTLNFLEGTLPSDEDVRRYLAAHAVADNKWTGTEQVGFTEEGEDKIISVADSLRAGSTFFTDNDVPKVLPRLRSFCLNLNRFTGNLSPDTHKWLFYHPLMDWWEPSTFIFTQEGRNSSGETARFSGVPASQDYYYEVYSRKKYANL